MAQSCRRCGREIPDGGLFYLVKLSAVSGYDNVIDPTQDAQDQRVLGKIAESSAEDLENDIYFEREVILCHACRTAVIELFIAEVGTEEGPDATRGNLLH
jgi:hypothetical protein